MRKTMLAALGAATMLFAIPAAAQDIPLVNGNFWNVTEVTIDDGHFSTMPTISRASTASSRIS